MGWSTWVATPLANLHLSGDEQSFLLALLAAPAGLLPSSRVGCRDYSTPLNSTSRTSTDSTYGQASHLIRRAIHPFQRGDRRKTIRSRGTRNNVRCDHVTNSSGTSNQYILISTSSSSMFVSRVLCTWNRNRDRNW